MSTPSQTVTEETSSAEDFLEFLIHQFMNGIGPNEGQVPKDKWLEMTPADQTRVAQNIGEMASSEVFMGLWIMQSSTDCPVVLIRNGRIEFWSSYLSIPTLGEKVLSEVLKRLKA